MDKKIIVSVVLIVVCIMGSCWAQGCTEALEKKVPETAKPNPAEKTLIQLDKATAELKSYQCRVEYLFSQPLFESKTLRKGALYYQKSSKGSKLRLNFETLAQDDEKERKYLEHYIFDGVWLTHINFDLKEVKRRQLAEPNEPADALELASRDFPIIGFSDTQELKKEFDIELVEQDEAEAQGLIHLRLKVKPDSIYKDDYTVIDFWIDKKLHLPAKIIAISTEPPQEPDFYQLKFLKPKVNRKINKKVFDFKIPKGFGKPEIIPLEKTDK